MTGKPDYGKVRACVQRVLQENNIVRPPILPREIASNYGLEVRAVDFSPDNDDVAGLIDFAKKIIYVNEKEHFNRQTFTIAHELGHFLLHKDLFEGDPERYEVLLRMPIGAETDPIEKEANAFAADLLVPRKFLDLYKKYADVDELAQLFAVSREVIGYRLNFGKST